MSGAGSARTAAATATTALEISGVLHELGPADWIGDKGYIGNDMLTPIRNPPYRGLLDWEKEFNKTVGRIRYRIERPSPI
jgi:hypothetical protein